MRRTVRVHPKTIAFVLALFLAATGSPYLSVLIFFIAIF